MYMIYDYICILYRCIQYISYLYIYIFIHMYIHILWFYTYVYVYIYIYVYAWLYIIQYYKSHCLVLLKRITSDDDDDDDDDDDASPGCDFRRFGLEECAAYWQQVVDMNDYQKTAFTSSRAAKGKAGSCCPKYSYAESVTKRHGW